MIQIDNVEIVGKGIWTREVSFMISIFENIKDEVSYLKKEKSKYLLHTHLGFSFLLERFLALYKSVILHPNHEQINRFN